MNRDQMLRILGDQIVQDLMGADAADGGFGGGSGGNLQFGLTALSELADRGYKKYEDSKNQQKAASNLNDAQAADAKWAEAEKNLDIYQQTKDAGKISAAQGIASATQAAAMMTGAKLSDNDKIKRAKAAADAAQAAVAKAVLYPKDYAYQAAMRAWQKVAAAVAIGAGASNAMVPSSSALASINAGKNFWTAPRLGLPTWLWILAGAAAVGGVTYYMVKRK